MASPWTVGPRELHGDTLEQAADRFARTRRHGLPVVDERGKLVGIMTIGDLEQAQLSGDEVGKPAEDSLMFVHGALLLPIAPPFRTLHERYPVDDLEEPLAEGIVTGHPTMPEFRFDPGQVGDIIAYLKSLER